MITKKNAPNLIDGFMIMAYDGPNRWQTGIEAILTRQGERAYLAQECCAEAVGDDPFSDDINHTTVAIDTWAGNYALRSGSRLYGVNPIVNRRARCPGDTYTYGQVHYQIVVNCDDKPIKVIGFDEVLEMLQQDRHKRLYMELSYRQDGYDYKLYAPCRYINFPHPEIWRKRYLHPISGQVLYEKDERFYVGYVVCHISAGQTRAVQFKLQDKVFFLDTKDCNKRLFRLFKAVMSPFFVTHGLYKTVKMRGELDCKFFYYGG